MYAAKFIQLQGDILSSHSYTESGVPKIDISEQLQASPGHGESPSNQVAESDRLCHTPLTQDASSGTAEWLSKSQSVPLLPSLRGRRAGMVDDVGASTSKVKQGTLRSNNASKLSSTSEFQFCNENRHSHRGRVAWDDRSFRPGPLVTELDVQRHRSLIAELKWEELRGKWQQESSKFISRGRSQTIL
jgi:hypothetical protein